MESVVEEIKLWITIEILKAHDDEVKSGVKDMVTISKKDFMNTMLKFVKLIERGDTSGK